MDAMMPHDMQALPSASRLPQKAPHTLKKFDKNCLCMEICHMHANFTECFQALAK